MEREWSNRNLFARRASRHVRILISAVHPPISNAKEIGRICYEPCPSSLIARSKTSHCSSGSSCRAKCRLSSLPGTSSFPINRISSFQGPIWLNASRIGEGEILITPLNGIYIAMMMKTAAETAIAQATSVTITV
jgi:hypothetical protein